MDLSSSTLTHDAPIPARHALGIPGESGPVPGPNRSPHLRWSGAPDGTQSFAILCVDVSAPSRPDDANKSDRTIPYDFPRADFYHWVLVDIPATITELAEGLDANGLTPKGKPAGPTDHGLRGINDYTSWFGTDPDMGGDYGGYDGPWPPFNDERVHRYVFTVYALDVPHLELPARFSGRDAAEALKGHVLAEASLSTTYTLNPEARL
jgi:Raf kinase inhibitor-like YbhB/YbcL family protein